MYWKRGEGALAVRVKVKLPPLMLARARTCTE